jgi:putative oxidoreductase
MNKQKIFIALGWGFTIVTAALFFMFGLSKIIGNKQSASNFEAINLSPYMMMVGIAEVVGAILLLIPRTSVYGALILSSVMCGAVAIHLSSFGGVGVLLPIFLGVFSWVSYFLRTHVK